jgi:hypothetical protein
VQHHCHKRRHTSKHHTLFVSLLPCGEGEVVVLQGQGSRQHMEQMFRDVPHEVLPHGQNQRHEGENFKLLAEFNGIYP